MSSPAIGCHRGCMVVQVLGVNWVQDPSCSRNRGPKWGAFFFFGFIFFLAISASGFDVMRLR